MPKIAEVAGRLRADLDLPSRLAESARATGGVVTRTADFWRWFAAQEAAQRHEVSRIPFAELRGWSLDEQTGNLAHDSGRFFTVEGLRVTGAEGPVPSWHQPIIHQPEVGILGIVVREIDGVLHLLMQAKTEPGNVNGVQLSPTVQATRSNYSRVHRGNAVPYLEHFVNADPERVLVDVLQSEQGSWFYRKRNRNMVVEIDEDVEVGEDFCWLTLGQVQRMLRVDNLVNMCTRTVLACLPGLGGLGPDTPRHRTTEILSWITERRSRRRLTGQLIPLNAVDRWHRGEAEVSHDAGVFFRIIAVRASSPRREVTDWTQPLIEPQGLGVAAFLFRRFAGVPHVLVHARSEPGYLDVVELAPTVQCTPGNYATLPGDARPLYLDTVLQACPEQVLVDVQLSEEGGRFHHARSRYLVVDAPFEEPEHPDYRWVSLPQLSDLLRFSHYVNVQARSLLACLREIK